MVFMPINNDPNVVSVVGVNGFLHVWVPSQQQEFGIAEMEFSKRSFLIFQDSPQQSFVWRLLWVFERFSTNLVAESESRDQCLLVGFYL